MRDRFGATKPHAMPFQQPTHGRRAHRNSSLCREHSDQKFLSLCRPQVTVVPGIPGQDGQQLHLVSLRDLVLTIVLPPIGQPRRPLIEEAMGNPINLGSRAQAARCNRRRRLTLDQIQDHLTATAQHGIRRSSAQRLHDPPLSPPEFSPNNKDICTKTHEELPSFVCWLAQRKCLEFLIFLSLPESRKAIWRLNQRPSREAVGTSSGRLLNKVRTSRPTSSPHG